LIDVSNPAAPARIGGFDTNGEAYGVQVVGNLAYVADGKWGLQIIRLAELEVAQTLVFNPLASANLTQSPIILNADVSSGLPIVFSVVSGPATVEGNRLNITGEGTIVVRAEQMGNAQFAATRLERSIQVVSSPAPPSFANLRIASEGKLRFETRGMESSNIILQFSPDLTHWESVSTNTIPGSVEIPVSNVAGSGFYRAIVLQ
jgi:hypothetical protein